VTVVLHGAWVPALRSTPAGLAIWGEQTPYTPRGKPRAARPRKPVARRPTPHPFSLTDDELRHSFSTLGLGRWAAQTNVRRAVACLPTLDGVPVRSTDPIDPAATLRISPWDLSAITLDEVASVVLLPRLAAAATGQSTVIGADLHGWIVAARFVLSLLARQRLLPGIRGDGDLIQARWSPVIEEPADRLTLRAVEAALPSAAIALRWETDGAWASAREALADYLSAALDAVARRAHARSNAPTVRRPRTENAWLTALTSTDPTLVLPDEEARALSRQVSGWTEAPSYGDSADAFRLCFRLDPPPAEAKGAKSSVWTLDYLLQATDDPSLLVPLGEVWRRRGTTARFLTRRFDNPHERVLASLGRAARVFEPIELSLKAARPEGVELSTGQAADLVRDKALLLKASGFGVLLPGLDSHLGVRLRLRGAERNGRSPRANGGPALLGIDSVVQYDWQLALGDEPLTAEEFDMLAQLKEPLVQLRGRWVDVRPEQIERALAFIRKHQQHEMSLGEALATALAPRTLDGVPVAAVETDGWVEQLLADLREGANQTPPEPVGLNGTLRPYQQRGVAWLATLRRYGLGALLADDMGLGKTLQTISLLLTERPERPTLVVCPTSVVGNWRREIERFGPSLRVLVHHGAGRATGDTLAAAVAEHDVVLSTYSLLHRDETSLGAVEWDGLVLDEAQNVKNAATRSAQAARAIRARWRVALTGTPVENRLTDLWSIFQVTNPGYLGTADEFRRQFALPIERASDADATARLKALTAPFILRRVKTDRSIIADLPEKQEMKVYCSLTREQATLYEAVVRDAMRPIEEAEGIQRRGMVLALLTRLKQVCNHPALLLHDGSALAGRSGKLARLSEMLEEVVAVDERALVFTQYAEMGQLLRQHLAETLGCDALFLHGGTPIAERDQLVARFQSEGAGPAVFVLSLKAGGTGLNLTRANHVFHFDRWWNPAVENQATDRAFRIGQTRNVQVHKYVCAGTFEETLDDLIERKVALAESIVGTSEAWITEMSMDELRSLFSLRRADAVAEE
jgi:superfamily II DNA or RNA helicase